MAEPERIGPEETREKLKAGTALPVYPYGSDEKFKTIPLEGALCLPSDAISDRNNDSDGKSEAQKPQDFGCPHNSS